MNLCSLGKIPGRVVEVAALFLFVTSYSLLATSCGFHLRGATVLPDVMARTELRGADLHSALGTQIADVLADAGAELVGSGQGAPTVLTVARERFERRVSSVDETGRATQYELRYSLGGSLTDGANKALAPAQSVLVIRTFNFNPENVSNVLGSSAEEELLRKEMQREGVRQLIRQFQTALDRRDHAP